MTRLSLRSRVGSDGVLHLIVPMSAGDANQEVQVTIDPAPTRPMTSEEWRRFVLDTAGSVSDPTFMRHEQGDYEPREELS